MPDISAIQNTPDVSFIDNKTIDDVRGDMVADFEAFMLQATGSKVSLGRASVHRMILYSAAAQIYQAMQYVDRAGKQSLLKYSYSEFLDNLALLKGVTREPAKAATTTIRFTASATRTLATPIPAGTRVSSSGSIYFSTMEYAEIPAGSLTVDVLAECTATGNAGNGLAPGEVSTIVDPVPYITSAVNQNTTEGGADVENDESLAERVYLALAPILRQARRTDTCTTPRSTTPPLVTWWPPATTKRARWILFSSWPTVPSRARP